VIEIAIILTRIGLLVLYSSVKVCCYQKEVAPAIVKLARAAFLGAIGKLDAISELWEKVSKNMQVKVVDCIWPLTPTFSRTPHVSLVRDATDLMSDIADKLGCLYVWDSAQTTTTALGSGRCEVLLLVVQASARRVTWY